MPKAGKYPLIYIFLLILLVGSLRLLENFNILDFSWHLPDWFRPIILGPVLITLLSTNLPEFLPKKVLLRLKWLHSRPGINQFYYFVAFQAVVIATTSTLINMYPKIHLIYLFDLTANLLSTTTVALYAFLMLRILNNKKIR